MLKRIVPSSGEEIPVLGIGTWQSFDVQGQQSLPQLTKVLTCFRKAGGALIDSSPMYGNAETIIGELTAERSFADQFFYATKVWITGKDEGIKQMEFSFKKMKRGTMDLMQIHNLTDWKTHLTTLREWKQQGKIRYLGITHYMDSMHADLERIVFSEKIDFVQFNYSVFARNAEKRLLSVCADRGVATLINRPFGEGKAFARVKGMQLPRWATETGIKTWSQFFLMYIISHPAVTVVIPATSDPEHAADNYSLDTTKLPDETMRKNMAAFIDKL